jgi:hypothetical protein
MCCRTSEQLLRPWTSTMQHRLACKVLHQHWPDNDRAKHPAAEHSSAVRQLSLFQLIPCTCVEHGLLGTMLVFPSWLGLEQPP